MSSVVAGKLVKIAWHQQQQQSVSSSSSVPVIPASSDNKDVSVELNTDVNNDNEDDMIVVDSVQKTSQASCS